MENVAKTRIDMKSTNEFTEIVRLIEESRNRAFQKVNEELVLLYFTVGKTVSVRVAEGVWGDKTVDELSAYILNRFPGLSGFTRRGLYRMKQFYETYSVDSDCFNLWLEIQAEKENSQFVSLPATQPKNTGENDNSIVSPLATQLQISDNKHNKFVSSVLTQITWSNHMEILSGSKTPEEKMFYLLLTAKDKLRKLELRRQIKTASFERSMLAKNQNKIVSVLSTQFPTNIFKDPYIFEFLDLPESHSEKDFEKALIQNLRKFILEIGKGFTYMGNQFRLQVGNKDYYTDLLFYHRDLQCLVLFELKIQEFEPEFLGKLNFYLEALDRDVKRPHEKPSIGVLLCKGKDNEVVEYSMARNTSPAMIADYETKLIPKQLLASKLTQLIELFSKEQIE
jgi:predicted nuclease of restriction endonuclease-like (RecB) superfamily